MQICNNCEFSSMRMKREEKTFDSGFRPDDHCTICLCPLVTKTKALHAYCPLTPPKWDRVATDDESAEILNALENDKKR